MSGAAASSQEVKGRASRLDRLAWLLWAGLLLSIPVTSFPPIARFTGGSPVSPLALLPLAGLVVLWMLPGWQGSRRVPVLVWPLLLFVAWALVSTALSPFHGLHPFRGQTVFSRGLRASLTLIVGLAVYLFAALMPRTRAGLRTTLRIISWSAVPTLLWASVQAFWILQGKVPPPYIDEVHRMLSTRQLHYLRLTGMAFEPSWLADQLVVLYLPLWMASLLTRRPVTWPRWGLYPEMVLFPWAMLVLYFSFSRVGYLAALGMGLVLLLVGVWRVVGRTAGRPFKKRRILFTAGLLLLVLLAVFALLWLAARLDPRIGKLFTTNYWEVFTQYSQPLYVLASRLAYAERVMYWVVGLRTFALHPVLGVGLGNTGFLFPEVLPAFGYRLPEMLFILDGRMGFPNPKSLWVRLLSETGIVGFALFSAWLTTLWVACGQVLRRSGGAVRVALLMVLLASLPILVEGFSLDTFALPHLWVLLGVATAALRMVAGTGPLTAGHPREVSNPGTPGELP